VRRIETMPQVASVNLLVPDMWSRLWANAFLLRKPHYFPAHTYEARLNTPLRGEWDLHGDILYVKVPGATRRLTPHFVLTHAGDPAHVRAGFGEGWYPLEQIAATGERWRWSQRDASLLLHNPNAYPVTVVCTMDVHAFGNRDIEVEVAGAACRFPIKVGEERGLVAFPELRLEPGHTEIVLRSVQPALPAGAGDPRQLALRVHGVEVATRRE
jgi:hypothetical protein